MPQCRTDCSRLTARINRIGSIISIYKWSSGYCFVSSSRHCFFIRSSPRLGTSQSSSSSESGLSRIKDYSLPLGGRVAKRICTGDNLLEPSFSSTAGPVVSTATPATLQPSVAAGSWGCVWCSGGLAASPAWSMSSDTEYIIVDHGRCVGLACTNSIPFV
ncbi:hypothetical protein BJX62DRAFT_3295 [Aspergillus germanicus]